MSCTRVIDFWHEGKNLQWYSMTSRRKRICLRRLLLFFKNVQAKSALDGALFLYRTVSFPHSQNFAIAASISAAQAAAMTSSPGWMG